MNRRTFMCRASMSTAAVCVGWHRTLGAMQAADLDAFIEDKMRRDHIPGSNTDMRILPDHGVGAIVFANTNGVTPSEITDRLLHAALML